MSFFLLLKAKEDVFKMIETQQLFVTIDFHSRKTKKILWKSMVPKIQSFFKGIVHSNNEN